MTWWFITRASVATMLNMQQCISCCWWVNCGHVYKNCPKVWNIKEAAFRKCRSHESLELNLVHTYYNVCIVFMTIGKTPVRIHLWCPITKMLIKACFLIQPLEQEGGCQKCCISLCSKAFINHFYQIKASPECLNILTYWSKYWVDRLRRTLRRKV